MWLRLLLVLSFLCPAVASAQDRPRAVVLDFDGRGADAARSAVVNGLRGLDLVGVEEFEEAGGRRGNARRRLARAAEELGIDVIVTGRVVGRGRRARTTIVAADAQGEELARETLRAGRGSRARARLGAAARRVVGDAIGAAGGADAGGGSDTYTGTGTDSGTGAGTGAGTESDPDTDPDTVTDTDTDTDTDTVAIDGEASVRRPPLIVAFAGIGFGVRSASFALEDGAVRGYESGAVPELGVEATLRPFRDESGVLGGAYARGHIAAAVGLHVRDPEAGTPFDASATRFGIEVGSAARLGDFDVGGSAGVGREALTLGQNALMPSLEYTHLRLGAEGGFRFLDDRLRASARLGWRPVLAAGEIHARFGAEGSAHGVDAGARITLDAFDGATVALDVEVVHFAISPAGTAETPATSGGDTTVRAMAWAGWSLR